MAIPYHIFTSLSPTLHQVCFSDLINESWIESLLYLDSTYSKYDPEHWPGLETKHFQLLSTICQLANKTIDNAVDRFYSQSFITSNVLVETDFYVQLNSTLTQFNQTLIVHFSSLIDTVHLFTQVDQPYTTFDNAELIVSTMPNETNDQQLLQVCLCSESKRTFLPPY
jgi:hypothetical protein